MITEPDGVRLGRIVCGFMLSAWCGAAVLYTLFITPALFERMGSQAGAAVAAIFPGYFQFGSIVCGIALLTALWAWLPAGSMRTRRDGWRMLWSLVAWGSVMVNVLVVYPLVQAADVASFGQLHGLSLALNGLSFVSALFGATLSFSPARYGIMF